MCFTDGVRTRKSVESEMAYFEQFRDLQEMINVEKSNVKNVNFLTSTKAHSSLTKLYLSLHWIFLREVVIALLGQYYKSVFELQQPTLV